MQNRSREKIALVVFSALILLGFGGLIGYLAVGHSWNVAASNIDDAAGSMEGYTVIVYPGTVEPLPIKLTKKNKNGAETADGISRAAIENAITGAVGGGVEPIGERGSGEGGAADDGDNDGDGDTNASALLDAFNAELALPEEITPTDTSEVQLNYREKKAAVLALDSENPRRYHEGTILKVGNQRFGVFSVGEDDYLYQIVQKVNYFKDYKVDFIVVITSSAELLKDVKGIDIVISTQAEGFFVMGETKNNTFYVSTPKIDSVGVILISPSKVVSAKTITPKKEDQDIFPSNEVQDLKTQVGEVQAGEARADEA
ncbi:MAG: alcohol dehydrogenase [Eggerthellaceae bacterium]|jgi:hypothetical protein|nr:alcohol dehydrogenase [Eggerthellaceae bacterium]